MYRFTVQPVVIILILFPAAVKTAEGNVEFWRENVILTCPEKGTWFPKDTNKLDNDDQDKFTFQYKGRSSYHCEYGSKRYDFYIEGKTCRNCFELDSSLLLGVLVVNLTMTIVVMIIVYKCTKKKMATAFTKVPAVPSRSGAPPTPSPDYQELRPHTRSQDTYSLVNRTG